MKSENKVIWSDGMFLRAQHFQQADRWTEHLVRATVDQLSPYPWGVLEVEIDYSALAVGQFAIRMVRGIFPDGTPFNAPGDTELPSPIHLGEHPQKSTIYLALPVRQFSHSNLQIDGTETRNTRFTACSYNAPDTNVATDHSAAIDVGRLKLRFLKTGDDIDDYTVIPIAGISEVRSDKAVILDKTFIMPSLNCIAEPKIFNLITELLGIIRHRSSAIASRLKNSTASSTPNIADYVLLHALNRADPMIAHISANAARIHPLIFFEESLQLAGELATFTTESKLVNIFPPYRHDDLKTTFETLFDDLRASLSTALEYSAVQIKLKKCANFIHVGTIHDHSLFQGAGFILAIRADLPGEDIRRKIPAQIKIGPVERIGELVNVALSGIAVEPIPVVPRQLPYIARTVYFEVDTKSSLWSQLDTSGAIALHLSGNFPNLEIELWALRK